MKRRVEKLRSIRSSQAGNPASIANFENVIEEKEEIDQNEDKGGYPNLLHLMFNKRQKDRIMRAIMADTKFLAKHNVMDYSLFLIIEEINPDNEI